MEEGSLSKPASVEDDSSSSSTNAPGIQATGSSVGDHDLPNSGQAKAASVSSDPRVDLELDVTVHIKSGQCTLYNKDCSKDDDRQR